LHGLHLPEVEVRRIARVQTLTVLPRLDSNRKRNVLQFLYESDLINTKQPIVSLLGANLREVNLRGVDLTHANLSQADLTDADLRKTIFNLANLNRVNLHKADLREAVMQAANLRKANLLEANLQNAYLCGADLSGVYLNETSMSGLKLLEFLKTVKEVLEEDDLTTYDWEESKRRTIITPEQLSQVKSLKGATMPDGSIHA
jgi:uncharacterized protein YjbI with pentapeptide repeats